MRGLKMASIAIQGLGDHPAPLLLLLENEQPDISYVITSEYSYDHVDEEGGFDEPSSEVVKKAGEENDTEIVFKKCDIFDPEDIGKVMGEILGEVGGDDKVTINYTAGSATIKLILGAAAVALSRILENLKIIYAIRYPDGEEEYRDQTEKLQTLFGNLTRIM